MLQPPAMMVRPGPTGFSRNTVGSSIFETKLVVYEAVPAASISASSRSAVSKIVVLVFTSEMRLA